MAAWSNLTIDLLWYWQGPVSRYYYPSAVWRSSRELSCWYLHKGHVDLLWKNGQSRAEAGSFIIPPPLGRNEIFSDDAEVQSLRVNAFKADRHMLFCPREPLVLSGENAAPIQHKLNALERILSKDLKQDTRYKVSLEELAIPLSTSLRIQATLATCFEVFAPIIERCEIFENNQTKHHPAVIAALDYISKRDLSLPFQEEHAAQAAGVSLPYLRRLFREKIGDTLKDWDTSQLSVAIESALLKGKASCKQIAYDYGFCSPSHFSHWFRTLHDCSPTVWRSKAITDGIV